MIRKLFLAALAAATCAPAQGQGRLVPNTPLVSQFAACAARRWPQQARALMAAPIGSRQERRMARRLAEGRSECVQRRLNYLLMDTGAFRGAVAEALLESDAEAMERLRALPSRPPVRAPEADGRAFVAAYARCIADSEPARAAGLLALADDAPAEAQSAAMLELGDLLNDCAPLGPAYRLNPRDVRSHIAVRLYELAFAAR